MYLTYLWFAIYGGQAFELLYQSFMCAILWMGLMTFIEAWLIADKLRVVDSELMFECLSIILSCCMVMDIFIWQI